MVNLCYSEYFSLGSNFLVELGVTVQLEFSSESVVCKFYWGKPVLRDLSQVFKCKKA